MARAKSSSFIVTVPEEVPSVAPVGVESAMLKVSLPSNRPSARIETWILAVVAPGGIVNVPLVAVKSVPDVAVPADV